jgi:7-cyano-7-deazaguanine synthase in queuosine biosynthesis
MSLFLNTLGTLFSGGHIKLPEQYRTIVGESVTAKEILEQDPDILDRIEWLPNQEHIVLASGGLDSTIAGLQYPTAQPVYIDLGQAYAHHEIKAARTIFPHLWVIRYDTMYRAYQHIIPMRNAIVLRLAGELVTQYAWAAKPRIGTITFSCVEGETPTSGGDKSMDFMDEIGSWRWGPVFKLRTPLVKLSKGAAIRMYLDGGGDEALLHQTVSCFTPHEGDHCGECRACFRRWIAGQYAGVEFAFATDPLGSEWPDYYLIRMDRALKTGDFTLYTKHRCEYVTGVLNPYRGM